MRTTRSWMSSPADKACHPPLTAACHRLLTTSHIVNSDTGVHNQRLQSGVAGQRLNARLSQCCGGPVRRIGLVFVSLQLGFFATSVASAAIPNGPIISHLQAAIRSGEWSEAGNLRGSMGDIIDRFSECIALTMDIGRSGYHRSSFLVNAVADRELGPCSVTVPKLEHWGHRWDSVSAVNVHQTRANDS